jgi:ribosomal protein S18 acetylase RimI-like enzyme
MNSNTGGNERTRTFRPAAESDIDELMRWFPDERSVRVWGGPEFRFPFTRHSFTEDMHWGRMDAFCLCGDRDRIAAFGQLYVRYERINLARLVVDPERRGRGIGKELVGRLLDAGRRIFACEEFSLFVFRDNVSALACYRSMGFEITAYPDGMPLADECYYLTRPVAMPQAEDTQHGSTLEGLRPGS